MEDGIPRELQHCHETCCEKGGRRGRRACMVQKWFHRRDVVSGQVDLHMIYVEPKEIQVSGATDHENRARM